MKHILSSLIMLLALHFFFVNSSLAASNNKQAKSKSFQPQGITTRGDYALFDVNAISTYVRNNGSFNRDPATGNSGFEWPKGTGHTAIYASGIWLGGLVEDTARVAVAEYSEEYDAGPIRQGINPDDWQWKMYKIKKGDNAITNPDYAGWPFDDGAPALKNAAGTADSLDEYGDRIPGLIGDMTVWTVFNDNNPVLHTNMQTAPLGIEVQLTAFGYNRPDAFANIIFYKWKLINKNTDTIKNAYITVWTDIDLGDYGDDYDGCDTTLGLGYTYNANPTDGVYGSTPPAAGFDFLQGPLVPGSPTDTAKFPDGRIFPGMKFLKMTSYVKYNNDATDLGNPNNGQEVYNYMQGLTRSGQLITDDWGNPTKFMYTGDPNLPYSNSNWIETAGGRDVRFMMSAGPFTLAPGDSQEIVAGNLIAQGSDNHNSVTALKTIDQSVQYAYDHNFDLPPVPQIGNVEVSGPTIFADNLNGDSVANPGEHIRFGFNISNNSIDTLELFIKAGDRVVNFGEFKPGMSLNMQYIYDGSDPNTYFEYDIPDSYTDTVIQIPIYIWTYTVGYYEWYGTISLHVVPLPTPLRGTPLTHQQGKSEWMFNVLVVDETKIKNHIYEISITDSASNQWMTLKDLSSSTTLFSNHQFPDEYGINMPIVDGFKVMRGNNFGNIGIRDDSTRWISSYPQWFDGVYRFTIMPPYVFNGGLTMGYDLPNYLGHLDPSFPHQNSYSVEVRFDSLNPQNAYRLRRTGGVGTAYVIQAVDPFVSVPFSVWDVSSSPPRQLTVAWRDQDSSTTFNPVVADDGLEIVFIYDRTYNPAGHQWMYQGESGDPADYSDVCTVGAEADVIYGMSLGIISGHVMNESPGTLYIRPWYELTTNDKFLFNPTITGVKENRLPAKYSLDQNYPNPFNPKTNFRFQISDFGFVSLKVYNVLGQEVATILNGQMQPGDYNVAWDASRFSSGAYFYRLEAIPTQKGKSAFVEIKKLLLIK